MDTLTIHFNLRDVDRIEPWGNRSTGLSLHWFGLTDGWYDVQIGQHHLYRTAKDDPGVDYQVVRLWEDLIEVAPSALESVPEALVTRLATGDAWSHWTEQALGLDSDLCEAALSWWWARHMGASHLRGAPRIEFWRFGGDLHVHWRSQPDPDGPVWSSPAGKAVISAEQFHQELARFDRELIERMRARVEHIADAWTRPEIRLDVEQLRAEQADRSQWLQRALSVPRHREHDWNQVLAAMRELENRIGSVVAR